MEQAIASPQPLSSSADDGSLGNHDDHVDAGPASADGSTWIYIVAVVVVHSCVQLFLLHSTPVFNSISCTPVFESECSCCFGFSALLCLDLALLSWARLPQWRECHPTTTVGCRRRFEMGKDCRSRNGNRRPCPNPYARHAPLTSISTALVVVRVIDIAS